MAKDFYLNERALASYIEKDWADHFVDRDSGVRNSFSFAPFDPSRLYCEYHEKLTEFVAGESQRLGVGPTRVLEIGSSLGRTFYELSCRLPSLQSALLVEPSQNLFDGFQKIFSGQGTETFVTLKGNVDTQPRQIATDSIQAACVHIEWTCVPSTFQSLNLNGETFDLVVCSNVIDQCHEPLALIQFLKNSTSKGGLLLLSCTYQWQEKYIGNAGHQIQNIKDQFSGDWRLVNETNIPFYFRVYERYWMYFLSHAGCFLKL